jgi:hypothetical protein
MLDDAETLDAVYDMLEKLVVEEGESARDIYTRPRGACGSIWHKLGKAMQQAPDSCACRTFVQASASGVAMASEWCQLAS